MKRDRLNYCALGYSGGPTHELSHARRSRGAG